jgi:hypothetical protein
MSNTYRRGRSVPYVQVPFDLIDDPNIDALAIATYVILKRFADIGSEGGAFVSDNKASGIGSMSSRTLIRRRAILRDSGWLDWEGKIGRVNHYIVHAVQPSTETQPVTVSHTPSDSESDLPVTVSHTTKIQSTDKQLPKLPTKIEEVFDYWNAKRKSIGLRTATLTDKRKRKIDQRFKDGFTIAELKFAIDGCFMSEYHLENGYLDIELICRDESKVEMFMARDKKLKKEKPTETRGDYYRVCPTCDNEHHYKLTREEYDVLSARDFTCERCSLIESVRSA